MKLRALVVDDSKIMRRMVMETLRQTNLADFEFTEAEDGQDALSKFDPGTIDIVFADWNMPKMSGVELAAKVRAMKDTGHISIIMVTSEKTMGKMETAMDKAGADGYVCKPFTAEEMQRKLAKVMMKRPPQQAGATRPDKGAASGGGFFSKLAQGL